MLEFSRAFPTAHHRVGDHRGLCVVGRASVHPAGDPAFPRRQPQKTVGLILNEPGSRLAGRRIPGDMVVCHRQIGFRLTTGLWYDCELPSDPPRSVPADRPSVKALLLPTQEGRTLPSGRPILGV